MNASSSMASTVIWVGWLSLSGLLMSVAIWYTSKKKNQHFSLPVCPGKKKFRNFPPGTHRQGVIPNFSSPGPVSSGQNVQILAKMCKLLAMARKISLKFLAGSSWRGKRQHSSSPGCPVEKKIWFFDPRNSCHTLNRPDISCQMAIQMPRFRADPLRSSSSYWQVRCLLALCLSCLWPCCCTAMALIIKLNKNNS